MWRAGGARFRLSRLSGLRLVPVRMKSLPVIPDAPAWSTLDSRARGTRFIALPVRGVLNPPGSTHMGFWSINPYIGCEFGCAYCYARETHRWTLERAVARLEASHDASEAARLPPEEAFERRILVKQDVAAVLARTLDPSRLAGHALVIGTATDPYQPAERRFRQTRSILELLRQYHGLRLGIITKSPLIVRDLDVLQGAGRAASADGQSFTGLARRRRCCGVSNREHRRRGPGCGRSRAWRVPESKPES